MELKGLHKLASLSPQAPAPAPARKPAATGQSGRFEKGQLGPVDVERYLTHYRIPFTVKQKGAQMLYVLEWCLFNPDHGPNEASIITSATGPLIYQCFHSSCKGKQWKDARAAISGDKPIAEFCAGYDPNWMPPRSEGTGILAAVSVETEHGLAGAEGFLLPKEMDPMEFYQRRGKRPVFVPAFMAKYLGGFLAPLVYTAGIFWRYEAGVWREFAETEIAHVIAIAMKDYIQADFITNSLKVLKAIINREEKNWPTENNLINCKNGVIDINFMELKPHDPAYGHRSQLPVNYVNGAWSDRWWQFLKETFPGDENHARRGVIQQFFGYCLLRDCRFQVALFLYGSGANGKSTLLDVLEAMVGHDNTSSLSLDDLCQRFKPQFLQNKLINITSETNPRDPLATEILKKLITGDEITCERKYGDQFQFRPYAKFVAAMNDAPVIPDKSYGFGRRIIVVNFERRFLPDEIAARMNEIGGMKMSDWLIEEIDGIFAWALEGLQMILKNRGFRISNEVMQDTADMMEELNPLLIFVNEMCEVHEATSVSTLDLWECYSAWCSHGKNRPLGRNKFLRQIEVTFTRVTKTQATTGDRERCFQGIGLTNTAREFVKERRASLARIREKSETWPDKD